MSTLEKPQRKRSNTSKLSRASSASKQSSKKASLECTQPEEVVQGKPLNYTEEIILIFYNSMLNVIVENWVAKENIETVSGADTSVSVKDFKDVTAEDVKNAEVVSVSGSQVSLSKRSSRGTSRERLKRQSRDSNSVGSKTRRKSSTRKSRSSLGSVATFNTIKSRTATSKRSNDWFLKTEDENVLITFTNGNIYEGTVHRKMMHGTGKFVWTDGTYYEGEFSNGRITGKGKMILPDLSYYEGDFCDGIFNGTGVFCMMDTAMIYSGDWKAGQKHGKGWLLYRPNNWYDGEWFEGKRQGYGIRHYDSGTVYEGMWENDAQHGEGTMIWSNNDFYRGGWVKGLPHGFGEYVWNAFFNQTLTFPIQNYYRGTWIKGKRNGIGLMDFGMETGGKLVGEWKNNLKHGPGVLVCGNGREVENNPLFQNDKPVHINSTISIKDNIKKRKHTSSLQQLVKQISLKKPQQKFEDIVFQTETENTCNPLDIPLHSVPEQVSFDFYILKAVALLKPDQDSGCESFLFDDFDGSTSKTINSSKWNILTMISAPSTYKTTEINGETAASKLSFPVMSANLSKLRYTNYSLYQTEEKQLRHCITRHLSRLKQTYNTYASITSTHTLDFKPILARMYLWQLWRDTGIVNDTMSIIDIDLMLMENPLNGYETVHYPFEQIHFWQFLQALVAVAWFLFMKNPEATAKEEGILGNCFTRFLGEYILQPRLHIRAYSLFEFRDLLPIQAVYRLYCDIGEPHTARDFLRATCTKKYSEPLCYLRMNTYKGVKMPKRGYNAVPVGLNLMFMPEDISERDEVFNTIQTTVIGDPFYQNLITFRRLGIKTVLKCLAEICPQIYQEGKIVNVDHLLSFLEFYEVLLLCAYKLVDKEYKENEKRSLEETVTLKTDDAINSLDQKKQQLQKDKKKTKVK